MDHITRLPSNRLSVHVRNALDLALLRLCLIMGSGVPDTC